MRKENWLEQVTLEDVISFALHYFKYKNFTQLEKTHDSYYGKYFKVQGVPFEGFEESQNRTILFNNPISLGEFGILETLDYPMPIYDDFKFFFSNDEAREICQAWIALVASRNEGRKIDGKTYFESFEEAINKQLELAEECAIQNAKIQTRMKKADVSLFIKDITSAKENEAPEKQ